MGGTVGRARNCSREILRQLEVQSRFGGPVGDRALCGHGGQFVGSSAQASFVMWFVCVWHCLVMVIFTLLAKSIIS